MKRCILKFFQCLLTYMICVNIIKHGLFNTIETACRWNVFSSSRRCHKSRFRTFKFKSVLNSVSTTCTCSPSSYLSGSIEPHSLSTSNTNLASVSRLNGRVIYLPQRAGILSQRSQRVNSTAKNIVNQRANIATDEKYCEWAAKHIKISCLPREY